MGSEQTGIGSEQTGMFSKGLECVKYVNMNFHTPLTLQTGSQKGLCQNQVGNSVVSVIRYISVSISIALLTMYFNSVSITVLACISVSISVIVNGFDLFQLTDISVSVSVN